MKKRTR